MGVGPAGAEKSPRILVVEDDPVASEDLRVQLEQLGYEVPAIAGSGDRALAAARDHRPDLVLMDIALEGEMDGVEAARRVQGELGIPVVYLTLFSDEEVLHRAKATNPFGYIVKPYTRRELHAVLSVALYKAAAERELRHAARLSAGLLDIQDAVITVDEQARVALINHAAEALIGLDGEAARGRELAHLLMVTDTEGHLVLPRLLNDVLRGGAAAVRLAHVRVSHGDAARPATVSVNPINADSGVVGAAVLVQLENGAGEGAEALASSAAAPAQPVQAGGGDREDLERILEILSHDVRAPLRSIRGFGEALAEALGDGLDPDAREWLGRMRQAASRMDRLLSALVTYGRLGNRELPVRRIDLGEATQAVLRARAADIEAAGAEIEVAPELPSVLAHGEVLQQILGELLDNALKFVAPGERPRVRIGAERHGERVRLWVEDRGVGVPERERDRVFGTLTRLHPVEAYSGAGMGLAIVRKGARAMGGEAGVEAGAHAGSRFWLELYALME